MKYIIVIILSMLVSSCIPMREIQPLAQINDIDSSAKVSIIRNYNFWGSANYIWPTLDGQDIAGLKTNEYTEFIVTEDNHSVGVRYYGTWKFWGWNHHEFKVNFKRGEQYYFLLSPTVIGFFEIKKIDQEDALKRISKSTLVPVGNISK